MAPAEHEAKKPTAQAGNSEDPRDDVTAAVEDLLNQLSTKFAGVSSEIFAKMDDMSKRLDKLEAALRENKSRDSGPSTSQ